VKRYTHIVLFRIPPLNGFSIKTPEGKFLSDIRPRGIVKELNRMADRINKLEEAGNALLWYFCPKNTGDISFLQSEAIKQWNKAKEAKL
jgi:hypothetical protein